LATIVTAMRAQFLDPIPFLVLYAGRILPYIAPVETGYLLGDRRPERTEYVGYGTTHARIVLGAMLTLGGFLLALMTSIVTN
jgi:hypothetical protein